MLAVYFANDAYWDGVAAAVLTMVYVGMLGAIAAMTYSMWKRNLKDTIANWIKSDYMVGRAIGERIMAMLKDDYLTQVEVGKVVEMRKPPSLAEMTRQIAALERAVHTLEKRNNERERNQAAGA